MKRSKTPSLVFLPDFAISQTAFRACQIDVFTELKFQNSRIRLKISGRNDNMVACRIQDGSLGNKEDKTKETSQGGWRLEIFFG